MQGTAEGQPFADDELLALLAIADKGIQELVAAQKKVLGDVSPGRLRRPAKQPGTPRSLIDSRSGERLAAVAHAVLVGRGTSPNVRPNGG